MALTVNSSCFSNEVLGINWSINWVFLGGVKAICSIQSLHHHLLLSLGQERCLKEDVLISFRWCLSVGTLIAFTLHLASWASSRPQDSTSWYSWNRIGWYAFNGICSYSWNIICLYSWNKACWYSQKLYLPITVVHNSFDVLPSGADQGSCAHKCVCYNFLNRREKCRK